MKTAIYMRVSTEDQSIELQERAISNFLRLKGISQSLIYKDEANTGGNTQRPDLKRLLEDCKQGKIELVVVWKLDRLSRSLNDLLDLLKLLNDNKVTFASVTEMIDLSNPFGIMTMQMLGVFAEFERNIIKSRTKAGMAVKKAQGVHCGRKSSITKEIVDKILIYRKEDGFSYNEICRATGLTMGKVVHILKKHNMRYIDELDKSTKALK